MTNIVVAIDGPAGSGKSTVARILARKLKFVYIDTGAMYRAIAYKTLEAGIDLSCTHEIIRLAKSLSLIFVDEQVIVNGENVSSLIRTPEVNSVVSPIAAIPEIRNILITMQRRIASEQHVVMEGRDIGTVVFPNALCKFYLHASISVRAKRRYLELQQKDSSVTFSEVESSIINRDAIDTKRRVSPLRRAEDAMEIDTSDMTIDEVAEHLYEIVTCTLHTRNQVSAAQKTTDEHY